MAVAKEQIYALLVSFQHFAVFLCAIKKITMANERTIFKYVKNHIFENLVFWKKFCPRPPVFRKKCYVTPAVTCHAYLQISKMVDNLRFPIKILHKIRQI